MAKFTISPNFSESVNQIPLTDALITPVSQTSQRFEPEKAKEKGGFVVETARKITETPGAPLVSGLRKAIKEKSIKPIVSGVKESAQRTKAKIKGFEEKPVEEQAISAGFAFAGIAPEAKIALEAQKVIGNFAKRISLDTPKKLKIPLRNKFSTLYTSVVDRFNPIVNLVKRVKGKLLPGQNPELLARRYLGVKGIAESKLFWKTTRLTEQGNLQITGDGLGKVLQPVVKNLDDFRVFLTAQRDLELAGRDIVGITGSKIEAQKVLDALKDKYGVNGFSVFDQVGKQIRLWSRRAILEPLQEMGILSKEAFDNIIRSNQFYIPFQRVIEDFETKAGIGGGRNIFNPKGQLIKRIKGSEKDIVDPLESLVSNTYKTTDFIERERVNQSIVNLRRFDEFKDIIKPVSPKQVPVAQIEGETIFRPSVIEPTKNTVTTFIDGKKKFFEIPEDVAEIMKGLSQGETSLIMKFLSFPTKVLRAGATLTPEFIGRNPLRDQFSALVFSKYGYIPGVDLVKGVFELVGKKNTFQAWRAAGGDQSMFVSLDRLSNQKKLQDVLGRSIIGKAGRLVSHPLEALQILSEATEKGTRIGAFKGAVKKGVTDIEAAFESRDITLDFARRGNATASVNKLVAFWNANIQGLDKLVRSFKDRPLQTSFRALGGITLPSVVLYLTQKDDPRYKELPQWRKDLFWNIVTDIKTESNPKGLIIAIPKPFELGIIFGTVPERILTWINDNDPDALSSIPEALGRGASPGFVPTIILPILENQANYSYFRERPIVGQGLQNLPPEMQANYYTSQTAKEIGKIIKKSPAKIENLIFGYGAGLSRYALDTSDKILIGLGISSPPEEPAKELADIPFLRAFIAREPIGSGSESVNRFFEILEKSRQAKNGTEELAKQDDKEAIEFLKNNWEATMNKGLEKIARSFSEIRKKIDLVRENESLDAKQKKRAIDALNAIMTEIAQQTLIVIKESQP